MSCDKTYANCGALFDLDGVIIDTEGIYSKFWGAIGREFGVPYQDFSDRIKGTTLKQILNGYFPVEQHGQIITRLIEYEDTMAYEIFEGVEPFLAQLAAHGIPTAIVTSSSEQKMSLLWQQHPDLRNCFSAIITDAQVTKSKPDPQGYILAAKAINRMPENCYVFEDSFNGLLAGRRAGAKVVGLCTTNSAESLQGKADCLIDNFIGFTIERMLDI